MKYTVSNVINRPLHEVVDRFKEPEGALQWMEGLQRIERVSGEPLAVGSKSNFYSLHKNKEFKIAETVLEQRLPEMVKFGYESPMGYNEVELRFEAIDENSVKQINTSYFQTKGFMKVMGFLFKGMFKKQSLKYMDGFKAYVEGN